MHSHPDSWIKRWILTILKDLLIFNLLRFIFESIQRYSNQKWATPKSNLKLSLEKNIGQDTTRISFCLNTKKVFLLLRAPSLQFFFLCLLSLDLWSGNGNIQFTRFLWKTNLAEIKCRLEFGVLSLLKDKIS